MLHSTTIYARLHWKILRCLIWLQTLCLIFKHHFIYFTLAINHFWSESINTIASSSARKKQMSRLYILNFCADVGTDTHGRPFLHPIPSFKYTLTQTNIFPISSCVTWIFEYSYSDRTIALLIYNPLGSVAI